MFMNLALSRVWSCSSVLPAQRGEEFPSAVLKSRLSPALSLTDRQEEDEEGDGRSERGGEGRRSAVKFSHT